MHIEMMNDPAPAPTEPTWRWFSAHVKERFEHAPAEGTVQYHCEGEDFWLTLGARAIEAGPGLHARPDAEVTLPRAVLHARVYEPEATRDPRFESESVRILGDEWLHHVIMWLTFRPEPKFIEWYRAIDERAAAQPRVTEVERLERPSDEALRARFHGGRPTVVTGALASWPEVPDLASLRAQFGHAVIRQYGDAKPTTLAEFIDRIRAPDYPLLPSAPGIVLPEAMAPHFQPVYFGGRGFTPLQLWLGRSPRPGEPITPLHRDPYPSFLGHVMGRKKFLLYPPDQGKYLYVLPTFRRGQLCAVKPWRPDHARFPLSAEARPIEVVLEPGDLLVNPPGWFHEVYAEGPVLSVSAFWMEALG